MQIFWYNPNCVFKLPRIACKSCALHTNQMAVSDRRYSIAITLRRLKKFIFIINYVWLLAGVQWTPLLVCTSNCDVTLGYDMSFFYTILSSRTGNGGSPCYRIARTIAMLRSGIICLFLHHTIFTNRERRLAVLQDCTNNCDVTLGYDMSFLHHTIFTNRERRLAVKLNRPRQCMRCRGRFGFTRGFLKLSYWNQLFLGVLLL